MRRALHRDFHSAGHLDLFMVAAISAVLVTRFYLRVTGYPQVGGATLHIAHMLWGGLLMLAALLLVLSLLGRRSRLWAALIGGVGFGLFIDEVGKFVTRDNDYFYRPAVALIYVTFVVIYLVIRGVRTRSRASREENLVNALQELEQAVLNDLQADERERALRYLAANRPADPLTDQLRALLHRVEVVPSGPPGILRRAHATAVARYRGLATHPAFARVLIAFFVAQLVFKLVTVVALVRPAGSQNPIVVGLALLSRNVDVFSLDEWMQLGSSLVSALLVALGIVTLRRSRTRALKLFHRSILVSIFVTQVFMFYRDQWAALTILAGNLLILAGLSFMLEREAATPTRPEAPAAQ